MYKTSAPRSEHSYWKIDVSNSLIGFNASERDANSLSIAVSSLAVCITRLRQPVRYPDREKIVNSSILTKQVHKIHSSRAARCREGCAKTILPVCNTLTFHSESPWSQIEPQCGNKLWFRANSGLTACQLRPWLAAAVGQYQEVFSRDSSSLSRCLQMGLGSLAGRCPVSDLQQIDDGDLNS